MNFQLNLGNLPEKDYIELQNNTQNDFSQKALEEWAQIEQLFNKDLLSFTEIWSEIREKSRTVNPFADHPIARLCQYMKSLEQIFKQALYSLKRLRFFATLEPSNICEFYCAHYLYDFITRIKTTTDLIALIINHIFELRLNNESCSLEKDKLLNALIRAYPEGSSNNKKIKQLRLQLKRTQNDWLRAFYELRNLVIHRAGLKFLIMGVADAGDTYIHIAANDLLTIADEKELLNKLLTKVGGRTSLSRYHTLDPVALCQVLWEKLTTMTKDVFAECQSQLGLFISRNDLCQGSD